MTSPDPPTVVALRPEVLSELHESIRCCLLYSTHDWSCSTAGRLQLASLYSDACAGGGQPHCSWGPDDVGGPIPRPVRRWPTAGVRRSGTTQAPHLICIGSGKIPQRNIHILFLGCLPASALSSAVRAMVASIAAIGNYRHSQCGSAQKPL